MKKKGVLHLSGKIALTVCVLVLTSTFARAQFKSTKKRTYHSFAAGLYLPSVSIEKQFTDKVQVKPGMSFRYLLEISPLKLPSVKVGLLIDRTQFSFNSYYFASGHSFLFDRNFNYKHNITLTSIRMPLIFCYNLGEETKETFTGQFQLGWQLRYLWKQKNSIQQLDSETYLIENQNPQLENESLLNYKELQGGWRIALRFQRNNFIAKQGFYLEPEFCFSLSKWVYEGTLAGEPLKFRDNQWGLLVGWKF